MDLIDRTPPLDSIPDPAERAARNGAVPSLASGSLPARPSLIPIVPLAADHADAVIALLSGDRNLEFKDWERDMVRRIAQPGGRTPDTLALVALGADGAVIGTVLGSAGFRGHLSHIAVADTAQGLGIGRMLLSAAEDFFRSRGCLRATLTITADNNRPDAALGFYRRCGYDTVPGEATLERDL